MAKDHVTFSTLNADGSETGIRQIKHSDIRSCPFFILVADHYGPDGTCECRTPEGRQRMIREWEYTAEDFVEKGVVPTLEQV